MRVVEARLVPQGRRRAARHRHVLMHAWRQFRKFELLGRVHNYAGSAGRRGGSSTADLSTQSRLLALAIAPWAARKGMASSIGRRNTVLMRGVVHVVEEGVDR